MQYQATIGFHRLWLGIRCNDTHLLAIDFLLQAPAPISTRHALADLVCRQLQAYQQNPAFCFDLPLQLSATRHQQRVWQAMQQIPVGQTRSYGELATQLGSAAQAVGQACGANPIPVIIPCHRVVAKHGIGGFAGQRDGVLMELKTWLLQHERSKTAG